MRRYVRVIAAVLAMCSLLCGCAETLPEEQTTGLPAELNYTVTVVNAAGEPYTTGVIVQILKEAENTITPPTDDTTETATQEDEAEPSEEEEETEPSADGDQTEPTADDMDSQEVVAMKAVDQNGRIQVTLPRGDYEVALKFTDTKIEYFFDMSNLTLTADNPSLEICLYEQVVYDNQGKTGALTVKQGDTTVKLVDGQRNYFLFSPETAGVYRFSVSDSNAVIGYYGYTYYILANSAETMENGGFNMTFTASMIGSEGSSIPHVIGIDAKGISGCVLHIERLGDPEYSIAEDAPWTIYEPTVELAPYKLPAGTLHQFDLTAASDAYNLVFNEEDRTYHLNSADGPQVLVQLSKATTYLSAISEICTTTGVKKYFYDENGEFVKREDYTQCLQTYSNTDAANGKAVYVDQASGMYPLTEDLKYIIQNHGEFVGWWDENRPGFIFQDADGNHLVGLNPDIAWLFLCSYLEQ